jgi:hypothetical protein
VRSWTLFQASHSPSSPPSPFSPVLICMWVVTWPCTVRANAARPAHRVTMTQAVTWWPAVRAGAEQRLRSLLRWWVSVGTCLQVLLLTDAPLPLQDSQQQCPQAAFLPAGMPSVWQSSTTRSLCASPARCVCLCAAPLSTEQAPQQAAPVLCSRVTSQAIRLLRTPSTPCASCLALYTCIT